MSHAVRDEKKPFGWEQLDPWGRPKNYQSDGNWDRAVEKMRQDLLKYQMEQIDKQFEGVNNEFLKKVEDNYKDYYVPQAEKQYENSRRELIYNLANRGLSSSSVANEASGDLVEQRQEALGQIGNRAKNRSQAARSDIEGIRARIAAETQAVNKRWQPFGNKTKEDPFNRTLYTHDDLSLGGKLDEFADDAAAAQIDYEPIGDLFAQPVDSRGFNTSVAPVAPVAAISRPTLFNNNTRGGRGSSRVIS